MVVRAVQRALVIVDMPFLSYQISPEDAVRNAGAILKRTGASAVKLEGGINQSATIRALLLPRSMRSASVFKPRITR